MDWLQLVVLLLAAIGVAARIRSRSGLPSRQAALGAALPTTALLVLFTLAAISSPTPHRASHAGIALLTVGCLSAATLSWTGMRFAAEAHSRWRVPLMLYGLAVGLFFLGETVAVVLLNW